MENASRWQSGESSAQCDKAWMTEGTSCREIKASLDNTESTTEEARSRRRVEEAMVREAEKSNCSCSR